MRLRAAYKNAENNQSAAYFKGTHLKSTGLLRIGISGILFDLKNSYK